MVCAALSALATRTRRGLARLLHLPSTVCRLGARKDTHTHTEHRRKNLQGMPHEEVISEDFLYSPHLPHGGAGPHPLFLQDRRRVSLSSLQGSCLPCLPDYKRQIEPHSPPPHTGSGGGRGTSHWRAPARRAYHTRCSMHARRAHCLCRTAHLTHTQHRMHSPLHFTAFPAPCRARRHEQRTGEGCTHRKTDRNMHWWRE